MPYVKASNTGSFIIGSLFAGFCMVPIYDNFWYSPERSSDGFYISGGLDPKILIIDQDLDFRVKLFYHWNRIEPSLIYENYNNIEYQSLTLGFDFLVIDRRFNLLVGPETSTINNQNKIVQSLGLNLESRLLLTDKISLSAIGNLKSRPELSGKDMVPSFYIHLNYLIKWKQKQRPKD